MVIYLRLNNNTDAHRALELLENYCANLNAPQDRQLRMAIEKLIHIFKSNLFKALLGTNHLFILLNSFINHPLRSNK